MMRAVKLFTATSLLLCSVSAWSFTIDGGTTSVGGLDQWLAGANLADSSIAGETAWVSGVLGFDVSLDFKNDGNFSWSLVDNASSIYAQALSTDPEYFLVKLGAGGGSVPFAYNLYGNITELGYAVIDLAQLASEGATIDIARVSHISEFNGTTNKVPEPGSLALLGLGLVGLGLMRRKAKQ